MPREVTFADEIAPDRLMDQTADDVCVTDSAAAKMCSRVAQEPPGIREPQSREENVSEAAGEDHDRGPIQSLQRRDGPPGITIFAVVVIFRR